MTDSTVASRPYPSAAVVTGKTFVALIVTSSVWITLCLAVWLVPPVFTLGGFAFMTVGWVALGPAFGIATSMVMVGVLRVLPKVVPSQLAVTLASVIAWSVALLVWFAIGFNWLVITGLLISCVVAFIGSALSIVVAWPRLAAG